jgi:hypothetical protein
MEKSIPMLDPDGVPGISVEVVSFDREIAAWQSVDVYAARTVVTVAVVNLSRRQRNP